jgi:hypothetical protein
MTLARWEQIDIRYGDPIGLRRLALGEARPIVSLAMANSVAVVSLATYVVCTAVAFASIGALVDLGKLWLHGLVFSSAAPTFEPLSFLVGGVAIATLSWLVAAATAGLYNVMQTR